MLIDCGMSEFSEQGSRERLEWVASGCCVGGAERNLCVRCCARFCLRLFCASLTVDDWFCCWGITGADWRRDFIVFII